MISRDLNKIRVRSLSEEVYVDELPLNRYRYHVESEARRIKRRYFRIINREHKINSYPEE